MERQAITPHNADDSAPLRSRATLDLLSMPTSGAYRLGAAGLSRQARAGKCLAACVLGMSAHVGSIQSLSAKCCGTVDNGLLAA